MEILLEAFKKNLYRCSSKRKAKRFYIWGQLEIPKFENFSAFKAKVKIVFHKDFKKNNKVIVVCREDFIKIGANWHVYGKSSYTERGELCWGLPEEFSDFVKKVKYDYSLIAEYILLHVSVLIRYHKIADIRNMKRWDPLWPQYSHGQTGIEEYLKERKWIDLIK